MRYAIYFVYIVASDSRTLYTGMTNDLLRRVHEHRTHSVRGFTSDYQTIRLVHYEAFSTARAAISREKQIKGWLRAKKLALIEATNPSWCDLWVTLTQKHHPPMKQQRAQ